MFSQNLCIFSGRLGSDPEPKEVGSSTVWKMGLAVDNPRKTDEGWESNTSWADLEYWENPDRPGLGNVIRRLSKGDVLHVHASYRKTVKESVEGKRSFVSFRVRDIYPEVKPRSESEAPPVEGQDTDPFV